MTSTQSCARLGLGGQVISKRVQRLRDGDVVEFRHSATSKR
jgi:hypothetical protein